MSELESNQMKNKIKFWKRIPEEKKISQVSLSSSVSQTCPPVKKWELLSDHNVSHSLYHEKFTK